MFQVLWAISQVTRLLILINSVHSCHFSEHIHTKTIKTESPGYYLSVTKMQYTRHSIFVTYYFLTCIQHFTKALKPVYQSGDRCTMNILKTRDFGMLRLSLCLEAQFYFVQKLTKSLFSRTKPYCLEKIHLLTTNKLPLMKLIQYYQRRFSIGIQKKK